MVKIIKNGRVIDPESRFDGRADLWIENGKIQKIVKKDIMKLLKILKLYFQKLIMQKSMIIQRNINFIAANFILHTKYYIKIYQNGLRIY